MTLPPVPPTDVQNQGSAVRVDLQPGAVRIAAPIVFQGADDRQVQRLLERLLAISSVRSIDIERDTTTVVVNYRRHQIGPREALSQIAAALQGELSAPPRPDWLHLDLQQVPGRVTRVSRRQRAGRITTTIASAGVGLAGLLTRVTGRAKGAAPPETLVLEGWLVQYEPWVGLSPAVEPRVLTGSARRLDIADGGRGPSDVVDVHNIQPEALLAYGLRRLGYLAAAGGCFALSVVGLVTPGIPTVPFVLATSYFLVRSSPTLNERFRRSRLFGQMVRDWQAYQGMRLATKLKIVAITLGLMGITLIVVAGSPLLLVVAVVMGAFGSWLVLRVKTVPADAPDSLLPEFMLT
ncbi:MAG: YbaN family protein [Planctomycetales bacterium]